MNAVAVSPERTALIQRLHEALDALERGDETAMRAVIDALASARTRPLVQGLGRLARELSQALGRLFALSEAYPELKSNSNVLSLQQELSNTENVLGAARQQYNNIATRYNVAQSTFPTMLVAGIAKASPAELWEIDVAAEREAPVVDLSMRKPGA